MGKHSRKSPPVSTVLAGITAAALLFCAGSAAVKSTGHGAGVALFLAGLQKPQSGLSYFRESVHTSRTHAETVSTAASAPAPSPDTAEQEPFDEPAEETFLIPEEKGDGGKVLEQQLSTGSAFVNGVAIRNRSKNTALSLEKEAAIPPKLVIDDTDQPQVLIIHTHTTETYMPYYAGYYNKNDTPRSTDESVNVCAVGRAVVAQLQAAGIGVIHDTTVHDSPRYTGSYIRSAETVEKNLKKYPSIKVILDVHRDGIMKDDTTKIKPTATVNGKKAAQMMMVMGVYDSSDVPHPKWQENLHFAMALQSRLHTAYPGVVRPISCVSSRYNQHMSTAYILIEMGSEANTLGEAVYSGQLLGRQLGELLNSLKG